MSGRTLGPNEARSPISGRKKSEDRRAKLKSIAAESGWDMRYLDGNYLFTKDGQEFFVKLYQDTATSGVLHRATPGRGLSVRPSAIIAVLTGERCVCPAFTDEQWAAGHDASFDPDCPIHHDQSIEVSA